MTKLLSAVALACALAVAHPVLASDGFDIFLNVEGIQGESTDVRHGAEIDVQSWLWQGYIPDSGPEEGKVRFRSLFLTKLTDQSTPALLSALASGRPLKRAVLTVRARGGLPIEVYRFFGEKIFVTDYSVRGTGGKPQTETVGLRFVLVAVRSIRILPNGDQALTPDFKWDAETGGVASILLPPFVPITDTDGDGIPDAWAVRYGLNPLLSHRDEDTDGDGATDYEEFVAGTDPTARNSVFKSDITFPPDGKTALLAFPSVPGRNYRVFVAPSPDQKFDLLFEIPASTEGSTSIPIPLDSATRFFRVQAVE